jgi:excinuclease ABC subunit C
MKLREKINSLPLTPGVYLMKDQTGTIIYIGKAKSLKKRVQSYFHKSAAHPQKIRKLVANIHDFDYILTDTEFEAFLLECQLIKELKPLFNKKMKSHLAYSYIQIDMEGPYRKISITQNRTDKDGVMYFGPYTSQIYVKKSIEDMKEYFKINCLQPLKGSPCLNYFIGQCNGLCLGGIAVKQYNEVVDTIISLLKGDDSGIIEGLREKMQHAASEYQYEAASKFRNYIKSFSVLLYKETVVQFTEDSQNIVAIERLMENTMKLFFIKGHKVIFSKKYTLEMIEQHLEEIRTSIMTSYQEYAMGKSLIIGKAEIDEAQIIYSYLSGSNSRFTVIPDDWLIIGGSYERLDNTLKELIEM